MNFRRITKDKAREIMSLWENGPEFNTENEYAEFRQDMKEINEKVSEENEGSYSLLRSARRTRRSIPASSVRKFSCRLPAV